MKLQLHEGVVHLFRLLLQTPPKAKVFIPTLDEHGRIVDPFSSQLVTAISREETGFAKLYDSSQYKHDREELSVGIHQHFHLFKPDEQFHYAFAFPGFNELMSVSVTGSESSPDNPKLSINYTEDLLREFVCAKGMPNFEAATHLIMLEQCYKSVMHGGFFGVVLPDRWVGSQMKFMKWWNENVALVARIALPRNTIQVHWDYDVLEHFREEEIITKEIIERDIDGFGFPTDKRRHVTVSNDKVYTVKHPVHHEVNVTDRKYFLYIFQKPVDPESMGRKSTMFFATLRHSTFVRKLHSLHEEHTEQLASLFRKHDWWRYSAKKYVKLLKESGSNNKYHVSAYDTYAVSLRNPSEMRILKFHEKNKPVFTTAKTLEELKANPLGCHIKLGPPVKVYTYSPIAAAMLHDLKVKSGTYTAWRDKMSPRYGNKDSKTEKPIDNFTQTIRSKLFSENADWILKTLQEAGLVPYILENDVNRIKKQDRWLNIQLTPVPRTVKIATESLVDENGEEISIAPVHTEHVSDSAVPDEPSEFLEDIKDDTIDIWETLYDDVDIKAVYPEVWNLWESRAKKMKMDSITVFDGSRDRRLTFDFQFEDLIYMTCKQSIMNCNVMGLGKTIESLLASYLRCSERSLFIVPSKLIGTWQEEIEDVVANYVRKIRRNWMGKIMSSDYKIIEWGRDCKPENLRTLNFISYERLPRVPNDAIFFKCIACGFVICSPSGVGPHNDKQICPQCTKGWRKEKRTGTIPRTMEKQEHKFDKLSRKVLQETQRDPKTGELSTVNYVQETVRNPHLKWTFANLLRHKFNTVFVDEANYVANPKAKRSKAMQQITGRRRIALTGTPVRGYPKSMVSILNWTFDREVFPDYRPVEGEEIGLRKFEKKYGTYVERENQSPKLLPKINNPELFQCEIAPLMIRHLRFEPKVAKDVPPKKSLIDAKIIPMDPLHKAYYQKWLEEFAEWWKLKREEADKQEGARVVNDLLVKLSYLINVSSIPHFMLDEIERKTGEGAMWAKKIGKYTGPLTAKFLECQRLLEHNIKREEKTIVFCWRRANLVLGKAWCQNRKVKEKRFSDEGEIEVEVLKPIPSLLIDGTVSNQIKKGSNRSERQMRVNKFRRQDYLVLWAGVKAMAEGLNIPECSRGIFMDYTWEPNDHQQALGRMLRPAQRKIVRGTFLCHEGTVDEYVAALVQLKEKSADEGVDYQMFEDFGTNMIPDFQQYANAIVEGKEKELKRRMWLAIEQLRKESENE